jgi:hypothetical protein
MKRTKRTRRIHDRAPGAGTTTGHTITTDEAAAWLRGEGDLVTAAMGRSVPVPVQLGVLAHGSLERLTDLGAYCRRGSVRHAWGTDMASLAGELARFAGTPERLATLQSETLIPLELEVLGGRRNFPDRDALIRHLRSPMSLPAEFFSIVSATAR